MKSTKNTTKNIKTDLDEDRPIRHNRYLKRNKEYQEKNPLHQLENLPSLPYRMPNTRDYMKTHTASLIVKGYTLPQGLIALNMSERTYYRWMSEKSDMLTFRIEQLKRRGE